MHNGTCGGLPFEWHMYTTSFPLRLSDHYKGMGRLSVKGSAVHWSRSYLMDPAAQLNYGLTVALTVDTISQDQAAKVPAWVGEGLGCY